MKKLLALVVLVCSAGYSYSSWIYGSTNNTATQNPWSMQTILPEEYSLVVNGVYYQYVPEKIREDGMKVHIGNQYKDNNNWIWRETDDWSGKSGGTQIRKVIGLDNVPRELWGDGSIEIEGTGTVRDANVVYSYKYDNSCPTPLSDPKCPGYDIAFSLLTKQEQIEIYNPLEDSTIQQEKTEVEYDEEEEKEEKKDKEEDIEIGLAAVDKSNLDANAIAQAAMLKQMNVVTMTSYYAMTLPGGTYKETIQLDGGNLPDNRRALRVNYTQQKLHNEMVNQQYEEGL